MADGDGFDRSEWAGIAQAGWTGISVPEAEGGAGLTFLEEALVAEELGRALYPGPFLATVVMALPLLRAGGAEDIATGIVAGERIATVASYAPSGVSIDEGRGTGTFLFVPNLDVADVVVVTAGTGAQVVERDGAGVRWSGLPTVDRTRRLCEL